MGLAVIRERCAGIGVHRRQITVHVQFVTDTSALLTLVDWLQQLRVDEMAMEGTGSYWKPVYNLLEAAGLRPIVGNASHMKAVPGRKTDVKDAGWICDLHQHGLIKPSFIPARAQRKLWEAVRYRLSLIGERAAEANRIQKVLEGGNIKLGSVVSDILGVSSRQMLTAIVRGEQDPELLAAMARGRLQAKHEALVQALTGRLNAHQCWMLEQQLEHVTFLDAKLAKLDQEVAKRLAPFDDELQRLQTITGVKRRTAEVIVSEIGVDMSRFADTAHQLVGGDVSGQQRKRRQTPQWPHPQGQQDAAGGAGHGRSRHRTHAGHLRGRHLSPDRRPPWEEASRRRGRAAHSGGGLHHPA